MGRRRKSASFKPFSRFLLDTLCELREEGMLFDILVECGDTQFKAHRVLLAAYSPLFKRFLSAEVENFSSSKLNVVVPVHVNHMRIILDFFYTGKLDDSSKPYLPALLEDAHQLQIPTLVHYIREITTHEDTNHSIPEKKRCVLKEADISSSHPLVSDHYYRSDIAVKAQKDKSPENTRGTKDQQAVQSEAEPQEQLPSPDVDEENTKHSVKPVNRNRFRSSTILRCAECKFTTYYQGSLVRHQVKHEKKVFQCPLCCHVFANKLHPVHLSTCHKKQVRNLKGKPESKIMKFVHDFLKKRVIVKCDLCQFEARSGISLLEHRLTVHAGCKMHICFHCKVSFKLQKQREAHQKHCSGGVIKRLQPLQNQFLFKRWSGCFRCSFCSFRSARKAVVAHHLKFMHKACIRCSSCHKRFTSEHDARTHLRMHPGSHFCESCGSVHRDRASLWEHELLTHGVCKHHYKCSECKYSVMSTRELALHKADCHKQVSGLINCNRCSKGYSSHERLRNHKHTAHHPAHTNNTHKTANSLVQVCDKIGEEGYLVCRLCRLCFNTKEEITEHVTEVHPGVRLNSTSASPELRRTRSTKRTQEASAVKQPGTLICSLCEAYFPSAEEMMSHIEQAHSGVPIPSIESLDVPKRQRHKQQANTLYQCSFCSYQHSVRCKLLRHEAYHTGNFPLKCKECGYGAFDQATMKRHFRRHTKPMDYMCDECGKAYNTYSGYRLHMFAHRGVGVHKCPLCGKDFHSPSSKVAHMFDHEGKKAYGCHLCAYECKYPTTMRRHLLHEHGFKAKKIFPRYDMLSFKARQRAKKFCPELVDQNCTDPIEDTVQVVQHSLLEEQETCSTIPKPTAIEGLEQSVTMVQLDMTGQEVVMVDEATLSGQSIIYIQDVSQ